MDKVKELKEQAASLTLYNTRDNIEDLIHQAEQEEISYTAFIVFYRQRIIRRIKTPA